MHSLEESNNNGKSLALRARMGQALHLGSTLRDPMRDLDSTRTVGYTALLAGTPGRAIGVDLDDWSRRRLGHWLEAVARLELTEAERCGGEEAKP